jgi:hypothetical protein
VRLGGTVVQALEEHALGAADVGYLDHGPRILLGLEGRKVAVLTPDTPLAGMSIVERNHPVVQRLVMRRPMGNVVRAGAPSFEKFAVGRRPTVARLDRLDL